MDPIRTVAVIGLGKMGRPMARHLLQKGFDVVGFDIEPEARLAAQEHGVRIAATPGEAASQAEITIVVVAFEKDVEAVLFGADGIAASAQRGAVIAIAATISPDGMYRYADEIRQRDLLPLDIPLCRGERAAEDGRLLITGGGDEDVFEACRPVFEAFSDSIHRIGPVGAGQVGKMVNNLILWACISANTEGFDLADKYGVDAVAMRSMLLESSAQNWALETQVDRLPMPWAEKDMMIVLGEADRLRLSLPLCGVVKEVIKGIKIGRSEV